VYIINSLLHWNRCRNYKNVICCLGSVRQYKVVISFVKLSKIFDLFGECILIHDTVYLLLFLCHCNDVPTIAIVFEYLKYFWISYILLKQLFRPILIVSVINNCLKYSVKFLTHPEQFSSCSYFSWTWCAPVWKACYRKYIARSLYEQVSIADLIIVLWSSPNVKRDVIILGNKIKNDGRYKLIIQSHLLPSFH